MSEQPIELQAEQVEAEQALAVRPPTPNDSPNAQHAKAQAIAALTMAAYQRASELKLTPEETKALVEEFPDECFQTGAAGKENLIYLEHVHLRNRLNQVLGPGQWSIVPRQRWGEDYKTAKGYDATRVYVEGMLIVRGCFVSEAIGDMSYYHNNDSQNYGDAVEGAKTEVLRRCCKELGIGLQAWDKKWTEGWWKRRREAQRAPVGRPNPPQATTPQPPPKSAPEAKPSAPAPASGPVVGPKWRMTLLHRLLAAPGEPNRAVVHHFLMARGYIKADQCLEDWPIFMLPKTKEDFDKLQNEVQDFERQMRDQPAVEEPA